MEHNGGIRLLWHGVGPYAKSRTMTSQSNFRVLNQSLPPLRGRGTRLGRFVDLDLYLNNQKFPDVHKPIILIVVT